MSEEKRTCEAGVWRRTAWKSTPCGKPAKHQEDGKWYCGRHLPSRVKERNAKRDAEWMAKWDRERIEQAHQNALAAAREDVITQAKAWAADSATDCLLLQAVERLNELEETK